MCAMVICNPGQEIKQKQPVTRSTNDPPSPNSQEASIRSPSRSDSSLPYRFDSQSSLENENGSHR